MIIPTSSKEAVEKRGCPLRQSYCMGHKCMLWEFDDLDSRLWELYDCDSGAIKTTLPQLEECADDIPGFCSLTKR